MLLELITGAFSSEHEERDFLAATKVHFWFSRTGGDDYIKRSANQ